MYSAERTICLYRSVCMFISSARRDTELGRRWVMTLISVSICDCIIAKDIVSILWDIK